ncbi:otoancorin-like isoform X1 [Hemitrygon akajei]|uniref:otoancorin-like isoform X1 n=2 Tax=Hemitrygon akajei TaxID=2704970 RepID=UPI003BFA29B0
MWWKARCNITADWMWKYAPGMHLFMKYMWWKEQRWNKTGDWMSWNEQRWNRTEDWMWWKAQRWNKTGDWMWKYPPGWNSSKDDMWWTAEGWNKTGDWMSWKEQRWNKTGDWMWKYPPEMKSFMEYMWWKEQQWNKTGDWMSKYPPGWNSSKDDMWWNEQRWNKTGDWMSWKEQRWNKTGDWMWKSPTGMHLFMEYMWWKAQRWNKTGDWMWKYPSKWNSPMDDMWWKEQRWNKTGDWMWEYPPGWNSSKDDMWKYPPGWNSSKDEMWEKPDRWNTTEDWMLSPEDEFEGGPNPIVGIFMFLHGLHYSMKDDVYGSALTRCIENSGLMDMVWTVFVQNCSQLPAQIFQQLLWKVDDFLLRAKPETFLQLPTISNSSQIEFVMKFLRERYQNMNLDVRMQVFQWARRSLVSAQCQGGKDTQPMKQTGLSSAFTKKPPAGKCRQLQMTNRTVDTIGFFILDAPDKEFAHVRPQQLCNLFAGPDIARNLSSISDMDSMRGKKLLAQLGAHCNLRNITRLGGLACFYNDAKSLDKDITEVLLSTMKKCKNKDAQKNLNSIIRDLAQKQPLNKEFLQKMGPSASALSSTQIANISDQDIHDIISNLGRGKDWTKKKSKILVKKFLKSGGEISSSSDLKKLGSLVSGLNSKVLRNVSGVQLLQAAKEGLEKEAKGMSSFQRKTIVETILKGVNSTTALESLSGSLLKELPLQAIRKADIRKLQNLTEKPWTVGQALYLCKVVLNNGSMSASKFSQLGPLTQGVTCEMFTTYGDQFGMKMGLALRNTTWLSRKQLMCAGGKLQDIIRNLPANANGQAVETLSKSIPSSVLLFLGEESLTRVYGNNCSGFLAQMAEAKLELLPRSSPVRGALRERALRCLNLPVSALNGMAAAQLGTLLCDFTGQNITDLPEAAFNASIPHLCKCKQFHPSATNILRTRLLETLGDSSQWTVEVVTSLGSMITLLDERTVLQLPNRSDIKEALLEFVASQPNENTGSSTEFQTGFNLSNVQRKIFQILREESTAAAAGSRRRRAADSCTVRPSTDEIQVLGEGNSQWSVDQLACMTTQTFADSVDVLGMVSGFSREQYLALKNKAIETWGAVSSFIPDNIADLNCILTAMSASELRSMDLGAVDTLDAVSACPTWTEEQRTAILERYLALSEMTAASLGSIELSGLGSFVCAMNTTFISHLQEEAFSAAARSLGMQACASETLDALKEKAVNVFGPITGWEAAIMTEMGSIVAGASTEELSKLDPNVMPFIRSQAVSLIPPYRFRALTVSQLKNLSPEGAASVTQAQLDRVNEQQRAALKEALGMQATTKTSLLTIVSRSPALGSLGLSAMARALPALLLLVWSLPLFP